VRTIRVASEFGPSSPGELARVLIARTPVRDAHAYVNLLKSLNAQRLKRASSVRFSAKCFKRDQVTVARTSPEVA